MESMRYTFRKRERLRLRTDIEKLFSAGNKAFSAFPVRAVCRIATYTDTEAAVLVSVPKRHLHRAVDRNKVKRRLREAYRLNKHIVTEAVAAHNAHVPADKRVAMHIALVWIADNTGNNAAVEKKVNNLLHRVAEKMFSDTVTSSN